MVKKHIHAHAWKMEISMILFSVFNPNRMSGTTALKQAVNTVPSKSLETVK